MGASERDEEARSAWRERVRPLDPRRLVFVDECSTNIALATLHARAPKGERAFGKAPRNWGKNVTLVASLSTEGVGAAMSVEGAIDGAAFETYVEHFLTPALKEGQVVVMDNLQVRARGSGNSSRALGPSCCSCRRTRRTSRRSRRRSRRSRRCCARPPLAPAGRWSRRSGGRSTR